MSEPTCIYRDFGYRNYWILKVPADMVACSGAWDEEAAHYGPILSDLNQDVAANELRLEMEDSGIDPEKYSMDTEVWEYVAWMIACDRMEETR